jgi:drug/metabolite transporter (DMT)-like permease
VASLNELIDLHTSRLSTSLHQRLPSPIFNVLFGVAMIAMLVLGYAGGLGAGRAPLPVAALILSLSSVFVLIYQMDSPSSPLFQISQWALEDVRRTLQAP